MWVTLWREAAIPLHRVVSLRPEEIGAPIDPSTSQSGDAIRSYRFYLRDAGNVVARTYDGEVRSDDDAHRLATLTLDERTVYTANEVWDGARLVCIVRRGE